MAKDAKKHIERSMFCCALCGHESDDRRELQGHIRQNHGTNQKNPITDRRGSVEPQLIQLLGDCFPESEDIVEKFKKHPSSAEWRKMEKEFWSDYWRKLGNIVGLRRRALKVPPKTPVDPRGAKSRVRIRGLDPILTSASSSREVDIAVDALLQTETEEEMPKGLEWWDVQRKNVEAHSGTRLGIEVFSQKGALEKYIHQSGGVACRSFSTGDEVIKKVVIH